jgi:hypothetical protein
MTIHEYLLSTLAAFEHKATKHTSGPTADQQLMLTMPPCYNHHTSKSVQTFNTKDRADVSTIALPTPGLTATLPLRNRFQSRFVSTTYCDRRRYFTTLYFGIEDIPDSRSKLNRELADPLISLLQSVQSYDGTRRRDWGAGSTAQPGDAQLSRGCDPCRHSGPAELLASLPCPAQPQSLRREQTGEGNVARPGDQSCRPCPCCARHGQ